MKLRRQQDRESRSIHVGWLVATVMLLSIWTCLESMLISPIDQTLLFDNHQIDKLHEGMVIDSSTNSSTVSLPTARTLGVQVSHICRNLSNVRRTGSFFYDHNLPYWSSPVSVEPRLHLSARRSDPNLHRRLQRANLALFRQHYEKHRHPDGGIIFDIGANRGIYTYYAATLGWEVHAFEIQEPVFKQLSHATLFNPKAVSDRVHLYPIGISRTISRSDHAATDGLGYLNTAQHAEIELEMTPRASSNKKSMEESEVAMFEDSGLGNGPTLVMPMDCLLWHVPVDLDRVDLVKIDIEGFEIAALQGAKQTLFRKPRSVGALLIEVGPIRWDRAGTSLSEGISELRSLSHMFAYSHVLLRNFSGCPYTLAEKLVPRNDSSHTKFQLVAQERMYRLQKDD